MTDALPEYAELIHRWQEEAGFKSNAQFAEACGVSKTYINHVKKGLWIPTRDTAFKMATALNLSERKIHVLLEAIARHYHAVHPEESLREDRWQRFQIVRTYGTPEWEVFAPELRRVIMHARENFPHLRMIEEDFIRSKSSELRNEYEQVLSAHHDQPYMLAKALTQISGLTEEEVGDLMHIGQSYVNALVSPPNKNRPPFNSHAVAWPKFADALMLGKLGLKEAFLDAVHKASRRGFTPRTLDQIIADLEIENTTPTVARILVELCEDRVGDGQKFASVADFQKKAGLGKRGVRGRETMQYIPYRDTIEAIGNALGIDDMEKQRLLEMRDNEFYLKYPQGRVASMSKSNMSGRTVA
ncbi:MAG: helix-turn-helix transcriptional regulator [Pseudomonadota bacterium]|nr:helix-turn-helix transcriptional regulator [Pseudomonadota bacterium]